MKFQILWIPVAVFFALPAWARELPGGNVWQTSPIHGRFKCEGLRGCYNEKGERVRSDGSPSEIKSNPVPPIQEYRPSPAPREEDKRSEAEKKICDDLAQRAGRKIMDKLCHLTKAKEPATRRLTVQNIEDQQCLEKIKSEEFAGVEVLFEMECKTYAKENKNCNAGPKPFVFMGVRRASVCK